MKRTPTAEPLPKKRKALDPEARQSQMIALATDVAEQQLRDGTASSQVICHYLKLGTEKEKLERKLLETQVQLAAAKADQIQSQKESKELYEKAVRAFTLYRGDDSQNDYEE